MVLASMPARRPLTPAQRWLGCDAQRPSPWGCRRAVASLRILIKTGRAHEHACSGPQLVQADRRTAVRIRSEVIFTFTRKVSVRLLSPRPVLRSFTRPSPAVAVAQLTIAGELVEDAASRARSRSSGPRAVDGADVPEVARGRGAREPVWIGPARRHAHRVPAAGPGFYLAVWAMSSGAGSSGWTRTRVARVQGVAAEPASMATQLRTDVFRRRREPR
jgi:hypothetical protein